jgi:hypothetical protein
MAWSAASDMPSRMRFQVSRPAMEAVARDVLAGRPAVRHLVGLYWIGTIQKTYDGGVFLQTGTDLIDPCGFWYFGGSATDPLAAGASNLAARWHLREF